jgi:acetyl-CoA carboxylase carboxyltransferase component
MARIGSDIHRDNSFARNEQSLRALLKSLRSKEEIVKLGGGPAAIEKLHGRGKLTARERIAALIDPDTRFTEMALFAGYGMYEEYGGAPSGGSVTGIGKIHGRDVVIVANDATVKAGAWFPITCKKNLRAQEISIDNRLPIVYLVDSAGLFLPLQADAFPDRENFGRIFRNNAVMSAMGIPQIAAIMGPCVAGGAYLPIMSDETLIVEKTGSVFVAGSHLVKAAIGEEIDNETLGGATVHCEISGVTDYKMKNDEECLKTIRSIVEKIGPSQTAPFNRTTPHTPHFDPLEIYGLLPADRSKPYDMYQIMARILDESELDEYKAGYGKTLITGYGRIDGWAVGILANQRSVVRTAGKEMQIGGVMYSDSADKAARFVMNCNQKHIPIIFFHDVAGFMVGSRAEQGGILKDGAKLVYAVSNSVVPKFTCIIGNSYGASYYAMCGRAYDPRLMVAWPTAQLAVMGGKQASETLLAIKVQAMEKEGKKITGKEQKVLLDEIQQSYDLETDPLYAAGHLWVDAIIDPLDTRSIISQGIAMAAQNPNIPQFNPGIMQV